MTDTDFVVVVGVLSAVVLVWAGVVWAVHRLLDLLDTPDVLQDFK